MNAQTLTPEQTAALDVARALAAAGIPVFVARPDPSTSTGFALPNRWQDTVADPAIVDAWVPGAALCAVMGHGLDLLDVDLRNGGDLAALNGATPRAYAVAATPSGGMHSFVASMGVGSRDAVYPGVDVKGGAADGSSRGFAFIAPTVKASKVTGEAAAYRWLVTPDLTALAAGGDESGAVLAQRIRLLRASAGTVSRVGAEVPDWYREFANQKEPHSEAAANKAISDKLAEVTAWKPGGDGFRTVLLRAAMTLGGYVGGEYLPEADARSALTEACAAVWGTADSDDLKWISQGLTDGATPENRFSVYSAADDLLSLGETPTAWSVYSAIGIEPFTPVGTHQELAEQVFTRIRPALRYAGGSWVVRRQVVWTERESMADWAVSTLARIMPLGNADADKDTIAYQLYARRSKFMNAPAGIEKKLVSIARHPDDPWAVELEDLDTEADVLWAGGLPWSLRASAEVPTLAEWVSWDTPHLRSALCTPVAMATPYWDAFIAAVWPDPDVRAWALRVLAIGATGYADEALPVLHGLERVGKTQVVSLMVKALGSYAHAADPRLLAGVDNVHASVVYALKGRRLSFIDEGPRAGHLALERLKQLTGGGELTGNAMRANPVTFAPTHTLVMTTNNEPTITDPALAARMRIIPCTGDRAAVRAARRALGPVWPVEAPGVLAMLMREAAAWLDDPNTARNEAAPASIRSAVAEMVRGQDPVADWVDLCTIPATPGDQATVLYRYFAEWFEASAVHRRTSRPSTTAFGRRLTELGYPSDRIYVPGSGATLIYRPLTVLQGYTGPYVPPPVPTRETSADAENMGHPPASVRNGEAPPRPPDSANAEQARSTAPDRGDGANCANANAANMDETDITDKTGAATEEGSRIVDGQLTDSSAAELSECHTARSGSLSKISLDSLDSYSSLPEEEEEEQDHHYSISGENKKPGEYTNDSPTVQNDLVDPPSVTPPITCDNERTVGGNQTIRMILNGQTVREPAKLINSDLEANPAESITERLLTSAKAAGTRMGKISEIDQHRGKNSDTSSDLGEHAGLRKVADIARDRIVNPPAARRGKLTEAEKAANKAARAAATATAKAAATAAKVAELAGEILELPAVVVRGCRPRSVTIAEAAEIVRRATARNGKLDIDIETNGYPIGHPRHRVQSVQLGDLAQACDFDPHDAAQAKVITEGIAAAPRLGAFSATADLAPLAHMGLIDHESAWERMWDVVIPAKLADPAGAGSDAAEGLKNLSGLMLGGDAVAPAAEAAKDDLFAAAGWLKSPKPYETPHEKNGWAQVDPRCSVMVAYACSDVLDTAALAYRLPDPGPALWERERALQRLVARVTYTGVRLDGELSARLLAEHRAASDAAAAVVRSFGIDNPGSSQQVAAKLTAMGHDLPRTKPSRSYPQGQLSADREALMGLRAQGLSGDSELLVDQLLEFGSHKNAISTFLAPYVNLCVNGDGRARPTIYTMEAKTGRMSSVRPNAQNIPREGGFRAQWIADPGYLQIGADFSGVELRVAAALSQDQHLLDIILADDAAKALDPKAKSDIHWKIALAAYGPNATKSQRYNVKRGVFGRIYGSGIEGIAKTLGITILEARMIVEILDSMTPGLAVWSRNLQSSVRAGNTHFPTHSGRVIHLRSPHAAPNYAIQGNAREIIVDALIRWSLTQWGKCVMWPVHDEIDVMVPQAQAYDATDALVACMATTYRGVPIVAEASTPSAYWADSA